jgi:AbrB family looped-hinge helix DNA binding protein
MKITVTITNRGVITLPAKLRRALGLDAVDHLIAETTPEGLLLRPAVTLPVELYSDLRVREFDEEESELAAVLEKKSVRQPASKTPRKSQR